MIKKCIWIAMFIVADTVRSTGGQRVLSNDHYSILNREDNLFIITSDFNESANLTRSINSVKILISDATINYFIQTRYFSGLLILFIIFLENLYLQSIKSVQNKFYEGYF